MNKLSENVKVACTRKGIDMQTLSQRIGIKPESLSRSLRGNPTLNTLTIIAQELGVTVSWLLHDVNEKAGKVIVGNTVYNFTNKEEFDQIGHELFKKPNWLKLKS